MKSGRAEAPGHIFIRYLSMIFLAAVMLLSLSEGAEASAKKKQKKVKPPVVAVLDTYYPGAVMDWAEARGMKAKWISSCPKSVKAYDGLIIPGGGDVSPRFYNESDYACYGVSVDKDRQQIRAVRAFAKAGKPVLGICRGLQVINVAFGGSLVQHIRGHYNMDPVRISKGSYLYKYVGKRASVKHSHHQCVKKLGKGLKAVSWDTDDNRIEEIRHKKLPVWGVQWHPEYGGKVGWILGWKFKELCISYREKKTIRVGKIGK